MQSGLCACMRQITIWMRGKLFLGGCSGGHTAVFAALADQEPWLMPPYIREYPCRCHGNPGLLRCGKHDRDDDFPDTLEHHLETSPEGMEMGVNLREHPSLQPGQRL